MYGQFYLDDWPNLSGLGQINDARSFVAYVLDGISSFVGRPLSYLSFAFQFDSWPNSPFNFKVVNLVIHLANGILVTGVVAYLLRLNGKAARESWVLAIVVAGVWLIHPLHGSTVPYVVQRMTLFSAFFSLCALLFYCCLRYERISWGWKEVSLISLVIFGLSSLGILSKENAVLTGMFILVVEVVVINRPPFTLFKYWVFFISVIPLVVVFVFLGVLGHFDGVESYRGFSVFERLLTQSRVVVDYLSAIVLPTPSKINIYNDGYEVSRSLTEPVSTILAVFFIFICTIFLLVFRKKFEWFAFGWLFFLVGHLLESTILPLELYFEHRNYLPMLGIVVAIVIPCAGLFLLPKLSRRIFFLMFGCLYVLYLGAVAYSESISWSSPYRFVVAAVSERPESLRARQEATNYYMLKRDYITASKLMFSLQEQMGESPGVTLQLRIIQCLSPETLRLKDSDVVRMMRYGQRDKLAVQALHELWKMVRAGGCEDADMQVVNGYAEGLSNNPAYRPVSENLSLVHVFTLADMHRFAEAAELMNSNLERFGVEYGILCARLFDAAGDIDSALRTLDKIDNRFSGQVKFEVAFRGYVEEIRKAILKRGQP